MTPLEALAWIGIIFAAALAIAIVWIIVAAAKAAIADHRGGYLELDTPEARDRLRDEPPA